MKYIRTKDGINRTTKNFVVGKEHYVAWHDFYEEIIKQADTIEELCDEFVAIHKTFSKTYCIRKVPFEKQDENFNIYGAIWTNTQPGEAGSFHSCISRAHGEDGIACGG